MVDIKTFDFDKSQFDNIRKWNFGSDWPVVYLIEDGEEMYVGESTRVSYRANQHYSLEERRKLNRIHILTDEEYNRSAAQHIESSLIQYMAADGLYTLQNANSGLRNHNYFDRAKYQAKFEIIWQELQKRGMAKSSLADIKNTNLFKYSPYKSLNSEQLEVADEIYGDISRAEFSTYIVKGKPGTGKTILAAYLLKFLKEKELIKNKKIALVVPMTSLRSTMKKVFRNIKGLNAGMVIGPSEVHNGYDILIVDEAHRLRQRKNITNYKSFDDINKKLRLKPDATELDWIMQCSNIQILFYDKNQSVRPSDIRHEKIVELNAKEFELKEQMRIGTDGEGEKYIELIDNIFDVRPIGKKGFKDYKFKLYSDLNRLVSDIKALDKKHGLSRMIAGFAWSWSKNDSSKYDIVIDNTKLKWNTTSRDWVNSPNAINEVGCIHTLQGYDLNYAGVIIGPELSFDLKARKFIIRPEYYKDTNGGKGIDDPKELERYIINIYKTLLSRARLGTFIYIVDKPLREYFKTIFKKLN